MLNDILGTVGTRYVIAFLNLALIFVNAKVLGLEGVGVVGLIWASINIIVMVNGILGGSTIVYFMNRYPLRRMMVVAYSWTLAGSALGCGVMEGLGALPDGHFCTIYGLSVLYSLGIANSRFLLGKDRIAAFNLTYFLQGGLLFFVLLYIYYIIGQKDVDAYLLALYLTNGAAFVVSLLLLLPHRKERASRPAVGMLPMLKEMFAYGLWSSADNIAETCVARLNYFFVQRFGGLGSVGLLDAGTRISESVCHISRSVALIEYSRVARSTDPEEQRTITLQLFKVTYVALAAVMLCVLLLPEWVYTEYLFSAEFTGIRKVIVALSVGIVALGSNSILSNYFIGSGKIRYSTYGSCIGLLTLLIAGSVLIPAYGVVGSAVSTSIAFTAMLSFLLTVFIRQTGSRLADFLPGRDDVAYVREKLRRYRANHN